MDLTVGTEMETSRRNQKAMKQQTATSPAYMSVYWLGSENPARMFRRLYRNSLHYIMHRRQHIVLQGDGNLACEFDDSCDVFVRMEASI
jgi:hypothetical protein